MISNSASCSLNGPPLATNKNKTHQVFFQIFRVFLPTGRQAENGVKLLHLPVCTNQFQLSETHLYRLGFASRPSISHYQFRPVKD